MLEHAQGWPSKQAGDSTGSAGAGVCTAAGQDGLLVGWEGQRWYEPSANIHQQWSKERGSGVRSQERVCWETRPWDAGGHQLPGHGNQPGGSATDDLRDIFGGLRGNSIRGAGRCLRAGSDRCSAGTSSSSASAGRELAASSSCWAARPSPRIARPSCCPLSMAGAVSMGYRAMACPGDAE